MPTILKKRPTHLIDTNLFDERPEHLAAIGYVSTSYSSIEEGQQQFFQQLLGYIMVPMWYQNDHPVLWGNVGQLLPVVESLRTRLDLISTLVEDVIPDPEKGVWSEHVTKFRRAASMRAEIIHGRWIRSDEWPKHIILHDPKQRSLTAYSVKDITSVAERIQAINKSASQFFMDCHRAYGRGRPDNPSSD
jgi:hypothetical protein